MIHGQQGLINCYLNLAWLANQPMDGQWSNHLNTQGKSDFQRAAWVYGHQVGLNLGIWTEDEGGGSDYALSAGFKQIVEAGGQSLRNITPSAEVGFAEINTDRCNYLKNQTLPGRGIIQ